MKVYKANPESFKGNYGTISTLIRVSLTGQAQTPDLYEVSKLLGKEIIEKRVEKLQNIANKLK